MMRLTTTVSGCADHLSATLVESCALTSYVQGFDGKYITPEGLQDGFYTLLTQHETLVNAHLDLQTGATRVDAIGYETTTSFDNIPHTQMSGLCIAKPL